MREMTREQVVRLIRRQARCSRGIRWRGEPISMRLHGSEGP